MERGGRTPARYGLPDTPAVRADLQLLGPAATDGAVLAALSRAGRPELALRRLAALAEPAGNVPVGEPAGGALLGRLRAEALTRGRIIGLAGASEPLGEHLAARGECWREIASPEPFAELTGRHRCDSALQAAIRDSGGDLLPPHRVVEPLRAAYRTRLAVIAAADTASAVEPELPAPDVAAVGLALSTLADALLAAALAVAEAAHPDPAEAPPTRLAVIAMGKCGATELNYVSDVDVMFVIGAADGGEPDPGSVRTATARASALMTICRAVAWEVDAALRPEGKAGPLVRTVQGFRAYYAKWAKTWEFQALLKARFAVGDAALGASFEQMAAPLVWSAADRSDFVDDVRAMRRRVAESVPARHRERELKLSAGGLRDVEFAVQLLQLVHGRTDETLRVSGTLAALAALTAGGYVGRADGAELAEAYAVERRLEHLAQLQHLRRTHSMPSAPADLRWLARVMGPDAPGGGVETLAAELARRGAVVRRLHEKLFYRPLLAAVAAVPTDELRLTRQEAESRLRALGFAAPQPALRHIAALTEGVSRRAAIQRTLLPVLLGTFADAPDPDAGLLGYRTVSDALAETPWYLRLLRDEGLVAQRLAGLLGISRLVADLLQRAPEVLRLLVHDADLIAGDQAAAALAARAARARTPDAAAAAARSARRHEMLRLACADLLALADTGEVISGLTEIADATVRAALAAAHREIGGTDRPVARVAIIAMGRFGGREMGYSSDADALFVAGPADPDADPAEMIAQATAIAELTARLLGHPSPDPPLILDADLRPEGRAGALVRTVDSYRQYWQRNIAPWQRQALLRARAIDDDPLAAEFIAMIDPLRYPEGGLPAADTREIRRIKARVDAERLPRGADRTLHTKLGRGGLADVEWTVQLLQLHHGARVPELRQTATLGAIRAAVDAGLIDQADGTALTEGWIAATRARNAIMLVTGRSGDEIPSHGRALAGVARACGYAPGADPGLFIDDYRRATRRARRVVDRLFDGSPA